MFSSRIIFLLIICSAIVNNYSMDNKDLTREIVMRRVFNTIEKKQTIHSIVVDFGRYIYAFMKDDTLWFNFQNGKVLEKNPPKARAVFRMITNGVKIDSAIFTDETYANFKEVTCSNKPLLYGDKIISLSILKNLKKNEKNSYCSFKARQFYMRLSPTAIIPPSTEPLSDGSGYSQHNDNGEIQEYKRVKLFPFKEKIELR